MKNIPSLIAVTQEMGLNRSGLVADAIFPKVRTGCQFAYIDWTDELKDLTSINDHVTCKSDVNETDLGALKLAYGGTQDHALSQVLDECCQVICGVPNLNEQIAAQKTRSLANKLLIGREQRAIAIATATGSYTDNTTKTPNDSTAVVDGGLFNLSKTNFEDSSFDLLAYFQGINDYAKYGRRNLMVTDRATLNGILRHPQFIGTGCQIDPITTPDKVAALLGVDKIVVADAQYNDGFGTQVSMKKFWPAGTILFTSSLEFITSNDPQFAFGLSAYTQDLSTYTWLDEKKGKGEGAMMQKIGHDLTETVLSFKAATLVKIA